MHTIISLWTNILSHLFQHKINSVKGLSGIFQITETYSHPPTLDERLVRGKSLGTAVLSFIRIKGSRIKTLS